jgi:tRNA pseudouridine38-40 synthase
MTRWKLTIEYDGGPFVGWQRQANGPSVQAALEDAVFRFTQEEALVQGAGRTDSGVHAMGQVAHVDIEKNVDGDTVRDAINFHLKPNPVSVLSTQVVSGEFHARFSATRRAYLYRILDRRPPPAIEVGRVWHVARRLDADAMHEAAQTLIGHHDFTSFRAKDCQASSPMRTLDRLDVYRVGDEIHINTEARSFLHHQVRNFTGTLKRVGDGKWSPRDVWTALEACDRAAAGETAPAEGLYLMEVGYEPLG